MKKIVILISLFLITLVLSTIFVEFLAIRAIVTIISIVFIIILGLNFIISNKYWNKAPNLLEDYRRNFRVLKVGITDDNNLADFDLTEYASNLYSDYAVIQRWYSLLRENGTVYLNIYGNQNYFRKNRLHLLVIGMLHPITLLEQTNGWFLYAYLYKWNELFTPLIWIYSLILNYFRCKNQKHYIISEDDKYKIIEIKEFLLERNLKLVLYIDGKDCTKEIC